METIQGVQKGRQFQQFQYSNGFGGSDLQTAASGHGGYGCCETGVDFATLLALLAGIALATYFLRVQIIVLKRGKRSYTESHPFLLEEFTELFLSTGLEKSLEEQHDKNKRSTIDSFRLQPLLEEFTELYLSTGLGSKFMEEQHGYLK